MCLVVKKYFTNTIPFQFYFAEEASTEEQDDTNECQDETAEEGKN